MTGKAVYEMLAGGDHDDTLNFNQCQMRFDGTVAWSHLKNLQLNGQLISLPFSEYSPTQSI